MKAAPFDYHRPDTVADAAQMLAEFGDEAKILAGGQSLVPMLALRLTYFDHLIDISRVDELKDIERRDDAVWIGAGTTDAAVGATTRSAAVPLLTQSRRTSVTSRSAPGARSAARSHTPIPRPSIRRSRSHSTPRWRPRRRGTAADPGDGVLHRPVGDLAGTR